MPNILLIPIDNRPVCYQLPKLMAEIDNNINLFMPNKEYLGGLNTSANYNKILEWTQTTLQENTIDFAVIALDTIAYGGLIPSRQTSAKEKEIKNRIKKFLSLFKNTKILATSSIMRISNNNINEEEKEYWKDYGKQIFEYSYKSHQNKKEPKHSIPSKILKDYLKTRERNFNINKFYIKLLEKGIFSELIFSQDDTAKFGLNVQEGIELKKHSTVKTGADEIPLALLSKSIVNFYNKKINITPHFTTQKGKNITSRYEDITIENSTKAQIELCGAIISNDADIELLINTPNKSQDDIALEIYQDDTIQSKYKTSLKPQIITDVKFANGADNKFIEQIFKNKTTNLLSFSGWNTTANSLGSSVSIGLITYIAKQNNTFNTVAHKKLLAIRLLDDWAYQANLRKKLRDEPDFDLQKGFQPYINQIENYLDISLKINYNLPWGRTFEVEICLEDNN